MRSLHPKTTELEFPPKLWALHAGTDNADGGKSFYDASMEGKMPTLVPDWWSCLETNKSVSANKKLVQTSDQRIPKSQSVIFACFMLKRGGGGARHVETMKNEKQSSGTGSKPHETELTTAAVCLRPWEEGSQDLTVAVWWDTNHLFTHQRQEMMHK